MPFKFEIRGAGISETKREAVLASLSRGLGGPALEAEASLHFNHTGSQRVVGLAEVCGSDVRLNSSAPGDRRIRLALHVELIEEVIEVGAKLKFGAFSQDFHRGETE